MKHVFTILAATIVSLSAISQSISVADVMNLAVPIPFSKLENHVQYDIASVHKSIGLASFSNDVIAITATSNVRGTQFFKFNELNQVISVADSAKTMCTFHYNSNEQLEIIHYGDHIVAITYDKKGNAISEAYLVESKQKTDVQGGTYKTMMAGNFIYTDHWKHKELTDKSEKIYMYEQIENGETRKWIIKQMSLYTYNKSGQITQKIVSGADKALDAVYKFEYKNGVLNRQTKTYTQGGVVELTSLLYEGNRVSKLAIDFLLSNKAKEPISTEVYSLLYDSVGNVTEFVKHSNRKTETFQMRYDNLNRILEVQKQQVTGTMAPMLMFNYNDHNHVVKGIDGRFEYQYFYVYDTFGNWTSLAITKDGSKTETFTREIQYR